MRSTILAPCCCRRRRRSPRPQRRYKSAPQLKQWELPNGLKVLFLADHKAPVVTVQVFYHAGAKDEPQGKRGMAHMFEHMMFKGSTHVPPEEHARFIALVGGEYNAFTQDDTTGYHDTVPPSALDFTMKLEAERMRNLKLTQKTIDSERQVVEEELRQKVENNPIGKALRAELAAGLYDASLSRQPGRRQEGPRHGHAGRLPEVLRRVLSAEQRGARSSSATPTRRR